MEIQNQTSTLIKLPTVSFRNIVSPYEERGVKTYIMVVNVKGIPESLEEWRGLNPRDPKTTSGVAKKIFETLKDNPDSFFFRNRGITLIADKVSFDNKTNMVELEMVDKGKNGLLDGGHTFRVIRNFVSELSEDKLSDFNAFVKIEVIEGIEDIDLATDIVESRNTSMQVRLQSLEELRKQYEEIHKILNGKPYENRIAYKEYELTDEGEAKDIDIKDILSYIVCFDVEAFDKGKHPIKAYSTKNSVIEHFKTNRPRIDKYIHLLPKILELRDEIYLKLPNAYNNSGGKFGRLTGVTEISGKPRLHKVELPFIGSDSNYRIPSGFIYPILASFRNLVKCDSKKCEWKKDPVEIFEELKVELASRVVEQALEFRNPNKLGKDNATWRLCYDLVEIETLKRNL